MIANVILVHSRVYKATVDNIEISRIPTSGYSRGAMTGRSVRDLLTIQELDTGIGNLLHRLFQPHSMDETQVRDIFEAFVRQKNSYSIEELELTVSENANASEVV